MLPRFTGTDSRNIHTAYLVELCNLMLQLSVLESFSDVNYIKARYLAWSNAPNADHSPLFASVLHVVDLCANKQVVWPHARWVVAAMTGKMAVWYVTSISQHPRHSMCPRSNAAANAELSVAAFC